MLLLALFACGPAETTDYPDDWWTVVADGQGTVDTGVTVERTQDSTADTDLEEDGAYLYGYFYPLGTSIYAGEGGVQVVEGGEWLCDWTFPISAVPVTPCPDCAIALTFDITEILVSEDADCSLLPPAYLDGATMTVGLDDTYAYYLDEDKAWVELGYYFEQDGVFGWFTPLQ